MSADEQALFGIEKLSVSRSEIPAVTHLDDSARILVGGNCVMLKTDQAPKLRSNYSLFPDAD